MQGPDPKNLMVLLFLLGPMTCRIFKNGVPARSSHLPARKKRAEKFPVPGL
jgi:hypothetical protein